MIVGSVENIIFHVANALRTPVMVCALAALALVLAELGALSVEMWRRRRRSQGRAESAGVGAREALAEGDRKLASSRLQAVAWSAAMSVTLQALLSYAGDGLSAANRMAKSLADYDLRSMRRLERTRMLVRAGPALGLMGTLIPLSPALTGLAEGNTKELTSNLRVAFSVTVLGLMIGAIAFAISLVRDRLYAQDLSDMQAIAAELDPELNLESTQLASGSTQLPGSTELSPQSSPAALAGEGEVELA